MNADYFDPDANGKELAVLESHTSMIVQMAQAELNQAVTTARAFPRSIKRSVDSIISLATLDAETAAECIYALPRGGKPIKGPSVRFAEIVSAMYGNCHVGSRIVAVDRAEKVVIAEGVFFDLETGMKRVSQVQRRISDKNGKLFNDDMIAVTGNAAASIAMREAVLKGVPKAIWRKAYEAADRVTLGTAETLVARRGKAMAAFAAWGIVPEQIFASLEVAGLDDIGLEEIGLLVAMFQAIKSGDVTVESYFPPKVDPLAARQAARGTARNAATAPANEPAVAKVKEEKAPEVTADGEVLPPKAETPKAEAKKMPAAAQTEQTGLDLSGAAAKAATHAAPDPSPWQGLFDAMLKDLRQSGEDAVMDLYGPHIEEMKVEAPELHHRLMEEMDVLRVPKE